MAGSRLLIRLRGLVMTPMPGKVRARYHAAASHIDKDAGDATCLETMRGVLHGFVDADPTVVGIVVLAVVIAALVFVVRRIAGRGDGAR